MWRRRGARASTDHRVLFVVVIVLVGVGLSLWVTAARAPADDPATSTTGQSIQSAPVASLATVKRLVAESALVSSFGSHAARELSRVVVDTADRTFGIPINCRSATNGCVFGDTHSARVIVLFGDSHVRMWLPAIQPTARADHVELLVIGRDGCPVVSPTVSGQFALCARVVARDITTINALRPAAIIMSERTTYGGVTSASWQHALTQTIAALRPSGAPVAIIGDIQAFNGGSTSDLLACLINHQHSVRRCDVANPNAAAPGHESAEQIAARNAHVPYIDPTSWLCTPRTCAPIIGGNVVYWDAFHITANYSAFLAGVMGDALQSFLASAGIGPSH